MKEEKLILVVRADIESYHVGVVKTFDNLAEARAYVDGFNDGADSDTYFADIIILN